MLNVQSDNDSSMVGQMLVNSTTHYKADRAVIVLSIQSEVLKTKKVSAVYSRHSPLQYQYPIKSEETLTLQLEVTTTNSRLHREITIGWELRYKEITQAQFLSIEGQYK